MTVELQMLGLSIALGLFHVAPKMVLYRGSFLVWAVGPRDDPTPTLPRAVERAERAYRNFMETFPYFAAAVLATHVTETHGWMTEWGAQLYFWGRVAYLPIYLMGIPMVRSLMWNTATMGIVLLTAAMI